MTRIKNKYYTKSSYNSDKKEDIVIIKINEKEQFLQDNKRGLRRLVSIETVEERSFFDLKKKTDQVQEFWDRHFPNKNNLNYEVELEKYLHLSPSKNHKITDNFTSIKNELGSLEPIQIEDILYPTFIKSQKLVTSGLFLPSKSENIDLTEIPNLDIENVDNVFETLSNECEKELLVPKPFTNLVKPEIKILDVPDAVLHTGFEYLNFDKQNNPPRLKEILKNQISTATNSGLFILFVTMPACMLAIFIFAYMSFMLNIENNEGMLWALGGIMVYLLYRQKSKSNSTLNIAIRKLVFRKAKKRYKLELKNFILSNKKLRESHQAIHSCLYQDRLLFIKGKKEELAEQYQIFTQHWNYYLKLLSQWHEEKNKYYTNNQNNLEIINNLKSSYILGEKDAVEMHTKFILHRIRFLKRFPEQKNIETSFDKESGMMVINYRLPNFQNINFLETKNFKSVVVNKSKKKSLSEEILYKIALKAIYEVAKQDEIEKISAITFNGWLSFIDNKIGKEKEAFILSIQASKKQILDIDLSKVDPKECFKFLKGISSANLMDFVPINPVIILNKNDRRIVDNKDVLETVGNDANLATMDWKDFEHLIRELFSKIYSNEEIEIKVTQASHDKGVDAIIFDPDPIKGGKTIIQAKRYTNLVSVSSIRDLYGTVINEGANRGILVTTSNFGTDSYEFAKDKPITLINGNNLLSLFEQHGHTFKINLEEAKKILKSKSDKI